jgi:hypothetical protein
MSPRTISNSICRDKEERLSAGGVAGEWVTGLCFG